MMRRSALLCLALWTAACAPRPQPASLPAPPSQTVGTQPGGLTGLTAQELVGRFGAPALQIREGASLKLQFRGRRCVMDAYLYPSGSAGSLKVTHVDTRNLTGGDFDQAACILSLRERPS